MKVFENKFDINEWKSFLNKTFKNVEFLKTPLEIVVNNKIVQSAKLYGAISLDEQKIQVYEVTLSSGVVLERNRVGLRNLLRDSWRNADGAFIVFHRPDKSNWRFTYVSVTAEFDESLKLVQIATEPKRYTYVLGKDESTRTATERFAILANKGSKATLDDVKETFSVEKLSKAFFDEYNKHYDKLCDYMINNNAIKDTFFNGNDKDIRDFNKKLLGRIVFLYFIQKKGWLGVPVDGKWGDGDKHFLKNLYNTYPDKQIFYQMVLTKLFYDTLNKKRENDLIELIDGKVYRIPYLNGGLFERENFNYENIPIDGVFFKELFDFFDKYNFTIYEDDPNDQTVAVDPEMLGHIFENLLEDNKDKGAFYTPKEIVHYMCQESLIEYLCTTLQIEDEAKEREAITALLKKKEINNILESEIDNINKALDKVKICDPAIGSGAFPMGLLQEMVGVKQTLWLKKHNDLNNFPAAEVKSNIIQNSIYGVDIEKGAVDIARLRFWLSLVVDENEPKPLPNLDYKIVVGNSLVSKLDDEIIEIDWEIKLGQRDILSSSLLDEKDKILKQIVNEQKEFFNADNKSGIKNNLSIDIRNLKIDLLINQLELMIKTKGKTSMPEDKSKNQKTEMQQYLQTKGWQLSINKLKLLKKQVDKPLNFFDWKLDFPEIMNPALFGKDSPIISMANAQILALNQQIDVINLHLKQQNINLYLMHLQTNIAQGQVVIIKEQLTEIENTIKVLFGKIYKVDDRIVREPDLSLTYNINSINNSIESINKRIKSINPQIEKHNPNIGFDIVIGNPPYGAKYPEEQKKYFQNFYESAKTKEVFQNGEKIKLKGSLDTFSLFIDKSFQIMNNNSFLNFIVPLAITSSDSMASLHNMLFNNCENLKISTFSNRPKKIFESADQRVAIINFNKNGKQIKKLLSTKVNKRYEDTSVQELIDSLEFVNCIEFVKYGRIPKIGTFTEIDILNKLFSIKISLKDLILDEGKPIFYRAAGGRYYNIITNFPTNSSAEKFFNVKEEHQNIVAAVLSSNLFYWFYHIYSDTLNMKRYELEILPIPVDNLFSKKIELEEIYDSYLKDLHLNSKIKKVNYSHISEYREFYARKSKNIINQIDFALKDAYGLTDEEIDFIINYDIKFRTDDEELM